MLPLVKAILFLFIRILLTVLMLMILMFCGLPRELSLALTTIVLGIAIVWLVKAKTKIPIRFSKVVTNKLVKYLFLLVAFRFLVFIWYRVTNQNIEFFTFRDKDWNALTAFNTVVTIIFAPLFEEIIFRGIASEYLQDNNVNKVVIVLATSFMFGLSHGPGLYYILYFGIFGMLLSLVYLKERNLWYCVILHSAYNISSLFVF